MELIRKDKIMFGIWINLILRYNVFSDIPVTQLDCLSV